MRHRGELSALLAVIIWGVSFVATKAALAELAPLPLVVLRFALGTLFVLAVLRWRGESPVAPRSSWNGLVLMGFVGIFVHQLLQAHGLVLTSATNTGWLIGVIPIWSALLAAVWLGESLGPGKIAGLVVGFAGALLVVTRGRLDGELLDLPSTRGDLLVLASTVNWAVYTILGRATLRELGALRATFGSMLAGCLMLAALALGVNGVPDLTAISPSTWAAIAFLGIAASGVGYLLWFDALERIDASRVSAFLYVEPLATVAAARATLGEPLDPMTVLGGLVVLAGVAVVQRAR